MVLFHGSEKIIETPVYHGGKKHNDYGYGFYCTEYPDVAREWAVREDKDGFLNCYEFDVEGLKVLNLSDYSILTWLSVLLQNRVFSVNTPLAVAAKEYIIREFGINYEKYDVMIGYRADDSYFSFAQDFISNVISFEQLRKAMHLGNLGDQVVLKSKKAFSRIKFIDKEIVLRNPWWQKRMDRDNKARKAYYSMNKTDYVPGGLYINMIMDQEVKKDDARVR